MRFNENGKRIPEFKIRVIGPIRNPDHINRLFREQSLSDRMFMAEVLAYGKSLCPRCRAPNPMVDYECSSCGLVFAEIRRAYLP
jgi:hypothetical protein